MRQDFHPIAAKPPDPLSEIAAWLAEVNQALRQINIQLAALREQVTQLANKE